MKRSEINAALSWAKDLLQRSNIRLPLYAYWTMDTWKENKPKLDTLMKVMLGWDITDFGMGDFTKVGAVLYTVRNGSLKDKDAGVPYCEKYILMKDGQRLPKHYHVMKTEDIINRTGGLLQVFLWGIDPATGDVLDAPVKVYQDGIQYTYKPGEEILLTPGNSISLTPYIAHIFGPKAGSGDLVVGEVSAINDDMTDNYFLENTSRFADIEEDEAPVHPLCNECDRLL
jgi:D-lyxose ketol-isomerase